jgi:hypothetical protein
MAARQLQSSQQWTETLRAFAGRALANAGLSPERGQRSSCVTQSFVYLVGVNLEAVNSTIGHVNCEAETRNNILVENPVLPKNLKDPSRASALRYAHPAFLGQGNQPVFYDSSECSQSIPRPAFLDAEFYAG